MCFDMKMIESMVICLLLVVVFFFKRTTSYEMRISDLISDVCSSDLVGVAIADVMTGMHTAVAILAALRHRDGTGRGQYIDAALLDTQVSWLVNQGLNYLVGGTAPGRPGNAHPNITPYQVFAPSDGHVILGVGHDQQFATFRHLPGTSGRAPGRQRGGHH